jgi:hypothetical protein
VSKNDCEELKQLEVDGLGLISAGFLVQHEHFGKGEVESIFLFSSGEKTIRINFEEHGSKALVLEYAKLKAYVKNPRKPSLLDKLKGIFK